MPSEDRVNILLVDDRPENLVALEALLGDLGHNLIKAHSGREALKHLLHDEFAVILLDVQMPEMDGFETATLIRTRERSYNTPIVFLTAINKDDEHVARGYAVGAVDYLFKPIVPEVLKSKVAAFVDLARKSRELQSAVVQLRHAEEEVRQLNEDLERRVAERTAALETANRELESEIAERRKLEAALQQRAEELAEAHRAKDLFLAMLGHELRNPLAPIRNAVTAMRMRGTDDPLLRRAQDVIDRQVQHLSRLVDDLLDVARITRGKIELRKDPVDLVTIAEHAVETARSAIHARRHELLVSCPPEPLWVEGDSLRLEQVITNLLTNAAKYTEPGGRIWLTVEREPPKCGVPTDADASLSETPHSALRTPHSESSASRTPAETAVVRVRDTGRGIARGMLPRIFEMFTQVAPTLDRAQGGLGLGLTLVKNLVDMHGGSVAAYSEGPGHGSEFIVRLPLLSSAECEVRSAESDVVPPPRSAFPTAHSRRILVVDDNADAAETLADLLALWGHDVRVAHTGAAALATAASYQPDLVLLDIGLPEMDGYEVARRLRAREELRHILLVAITGYGQEEDRRRSQEAMLDFHLTKPVDLDALQEVLALTTA